MIFPYVPIDYLIVISNPTTIIETSEYIPNKLTHNANLLFKIDELAKSFTEQHLTENQVMKLCTALGSARLIENQCCKNQKKTQKVEDITFHISKC
jgi:hypothetical protein